MHQTSMEQLNQSEGRDAQVIFKTGEREKGIRAEVAGGGPPRSKGSSDSLPSNSQVDNNIHERSNELEEVQSGSLCSGSGEISGEHASSCDVASSAFASSSCD